MKTSAPILLALLAACDSSTTDQTRVLEEVTTLRREIAELKQSPLMQVSGILSLDELSGKIERLSKKVDALPATLPPPVQLSSALTVGDLAGGVGGTQEGIHDLYWVLSKVQIDREDCIVLCLYRAEPGGKAFELVDVRRLNYDLRLVELKRHDASVRDVAKELERMEKKK